MFAGVGLYITSPILDCHHSIPSGIRNILPTHYFDAWVDMFTQSHVSSRHVARVRPAARATSLLFVAVGPGGSAARTSSAERARTRSRSSVGLHW